MSARFFIVSTAPFRGAAHPRGLAWALTAAVLVLGVALAAAGRLPDLPMDAPSQSPSTLHHEGLQPTQSLAAAEGLNAPAGGLVAIPPSAAGSDCMRPVDPPPFAPGGDDVVPSPEPEPSPSLAQASRTDGAASSSARTAEPGGRPSLSPSQAAPPSLMLWLDAPTVAAGKRAVLHLAALGVDTCRGLGLLQGLQRTAEGIVLGPLSPGRFRLTVACRGPGGEVERSVGLAVPWPVLDNSRANARQADFDLDAVGLPTPTLAPAGALPRTPGDFFQDGSLALFDVAPDAEGQPLARFSARDAQGRWVDRSESLLPDLAVRRVCGRPRQALTADFNGDGKPDVLLTCAGLGGLSGQAPATTAEVDRQTLFLSQPDGRYIRVEAAWPLGPGEVEALDADGDGLIDLVAAGAPSTAAALGADRPVLLQGLGDGRFYRPR